jgi:hypothetical protein
MRKAIWKEWFNGKTEAERYEDMQRVLRLSALQRCKGLLDYFDSEDVWKAAKESKRFDVLMFIFGQGDRRRALFAKSHEK